MISGTNVQNVLKSKIEKSLKNKKIQFIWHMSIDNQIKSIDRIQKSVKKDNSDLIVGIGGGRSVDTAKLISYNLSIPFVSLPTAASHDGMASPFVSVKSDKPHSIVASASTRCFCRYRCNQKNPSKLLASGCGDLIANIIAVKKIGS